MKKNLVILLGPTAIGKTDLSLKLAEKLNGEIISCDSMQIYRQMDIGSAKVSPKEQARIKHHLIDIVDPDQSYTVADYKKDAEKIIEDLNEKSKLAIVTGGTGLYINSLVYNLNFTKAEPNYELREKLETQAQEEGVESVFEILKSIDKESSEKLHPNDLKRVIRAIEIYEQSGVTMGDYNKNFRTEVEDYNLYMIGLNMDRAKLYERINLRVDLMMEAGLVDEVKGLMDQGYSRDLVAMQGIGYKEIIDYLEGRLSLEASLELIKKKSRNYAKRQLTWFRRDDRIHWYNKDDYGSDQELLEKILKDLSLNKLF